MSNNYLWVAKLGQIELQYRLSKSEQPESCILIRYTYDKDLEMIESEGHAVNEMVQGPCAHLRVKCWDMGIVA
jgi:hypothetical protein